MLVTAAMRNVAADFLLNIPKLIAEAEGDGSWDWIVDGCREGAIILPISIHTVLYMHP